MPQNNILFNSPSRRLLLLLVAAALVGLLPGPDEREPVSPVFSSPVSPVVYLPWIQVGGVGLEDEPQVEPTEEAQGLPAVDPDEPGVEPTEEAPGVD